MKRRNFIKQSAASSALVGLSGLSLHSCFEETKKHITILHTNDVHSHIDPFPKGHSEFPNLGGLARRATLVEGIRQEIIQWLEEKRADVAFMSHKEPMSYDWIPLAEDQMLAVLPKTHQLARAAAYPLQKCRDESFIMPALGRDRGTACGCGVSGHARPDRTPDRTAHHDVVRRQSRSAHAADTDETGAEPDGG